MSAIRALAASVLAAGCASAPPVKEAAAPAVQDADAIQIVRVETVGPTGRLNARCGVKNDRGSSEILAPGVAEVLRSAKPLEILCFTGGYRIAMRSLESTGDVVGPAATGAMAGGAMTAVAALPLLAVPVFGPFMYAGAVGSGALVGGAVNAVDKHTQGKIYTYPPSVIITMVPEDGPIGAAQKVQGYAQPPMSAEPIPQAAVAGLSASPAPPVAPMMSLRTPPLMPVVHEVPAFPEEVAKAGLHEGRVRAQLDIDAEGTVTNVQVIEAKPEGVFDRAVVEALRRWKFARGAPARRFDTEIEFRR